MYMYVLMYMYVHVSIGGLPNEVWAVAMPSKKLNTPDMVALCASSCGRRRFSAI